MKSLEVDAMKAQAVIGLAKEMQEKSRLPTVPDSATTDDENAVKHSANGDQEVEVTKENIIELNLEDESNQDTG